MNKNQVKKPRNITVFDENMKPMRPCSEKTAWTLVTRKRAVYLNEAKTAIQITISNRMIKELKREIIKKADRVCYICGKRIPLDEKATVDHMYPQYIKNNRISGLDTEENMRCCCWDCNHSKGHMDIETYTLYRFMTLLAIICAKIKILMTKELLMSALKLSEEDVYANSITSYPTTVCTNSDNVIKGT